VARLRPGKIRYGLVTNEQGGILDDVLVYHLTDARGQSFYQMVVNAGNREKIVRWISSHLDSAAGVAFADQTLDSAMIAVQGPQALAVTRALVAADLQRLSYYSGTVTTICGYPCVASRTGYTGEDGCELIVDRAVACRVWEAILAQGRSCGARPVGLGARDTLRLEAAMPLYGHELREDLDPFQAGLAFAVDLEGHDFIGGDTLRALRQAEPARTRIGLELEGKRVPREHCPVRDGDVLVGEVTSGTYSPTLERPIAMAYVRPHASYVGRPLHVDIRGRLEAATVVKLPFYVRPAT
jgi:aminomethyltransferase